MATPGDINIIAAKILIDSQEALKSLKSVDKQAGVTAANLQKIGMAGKATGEQVSSGFNRAITAVNAFRIALGVLVSMLIFSVIQAFQSMVQGAIKGLVELESHMFNIVGAEERLSKQGIEISVEGLEETIAQLQKLDPLLSKYQATELVSSLTTKVAPALGLGQKEVTSLAKSIAVLAVQNRALGKSFEEVEMQVQTGLLSGQVTRGINQLGTKITEQAVAEEAVRMRLVANEAALKGLNAQQQERIKALAIISILERDTAQQAANLPAFFQTASGQIGIMQARFQDLLTRLGEKFSPLIKEIIGGIIGILEKVNQSLTENEDGWNVAISLLTIAAKATIELINVFIEFHAWLGKVGARLYEILGAIPLLGDVVKRLFPGQEYADTPTGPQPPPPPSADESKYQEELQDKLTDIMQEGQDKRLDLERDYQQKLADIALDYRRKLADIARDTADKRADAQADYGDKIEDINRSANESVATAQEEFRQKEIDREEEYQNKLKELREKFLFDLEDALRARDARQVLRLIRQYNMDKQAIEDKKKQDQQQAQADLQQKVEDIERERQLKIEAAKREYQDKLKEIAKGEARARQEAALAHRRQLEDARIAHQRQLAEQREYLQRKLRDLAQALQQEYNMTASQVQAMMQLMNQAVGGTSGGFTSGFSGTGYGSVSTSGGTLNTTSPYILAPGSNVNAPVWIPNPNYRMAEGGTIVAHKPTTAIFGERGPEVAQFTPLNRSGRDVNKIFGGASLGGDMGGSLNLKIAISDGLVAEIVDTSLDKVAAHIEHTRRAV